MICGLNSIANLSVQLLSKASECHSPARLFLQEGFRHVRQTSQCIGLTLKLLSEKGESDDVECIDVLLRRAEAAINALHNSTEYLSQYEGSGGVGPGMSALCPSIQVLVAALVNVQSRCQSKLSDCYKIDCEQPIGSTVPRPGVRQRHSCWDGPAAFIGPWPYGVTTPNFYRRKSFVTNRRASSSTQTPAKALSL